MKPRAIAAALALISAEAAAAPPCTVSINLDATGMNATLSDLATLFPDFRARADKGVTVTMEHRLVVPTAGGPADYSFGCSVTYDLWDKTYTIVAFSSESMAAREKIVVATLSALPTPCKEGHFLKPGKLPHGADVEVDTVIDPVSTEQVAKTRSWLAERGIGSASQAILGRAVAALIDLKEETKVSRHCQLRAGP